MVQTKNLNVFQMSCKIPMCFNQVKRTYWESENCVKWLPSERRELAKAEFYIQNPSTKTCCATKSQFLTAHFYGSRFSLPCHRGATYFFSQSTFIAPAPRNWFLNDHERSSIRAEDDIYGQCVIYDFAHFTAGVCAKQSVQSSAAADQIAFNKTWIFIVLPRQFHCIVKPGDTLREIYCGD